MIRSRILGRSCALLAPAALACSPSAGGPSFVTLGVDVEPATAMFGGGGEEPPPENDMDLCVRVPVLLGSSVEKSESVQGLAVKIAATRESAEVTFPGTDRGDTERSFSLSELRSGVEESVTVSANGASFDVAISTFCTNP